MCLSVKEFDEPRAGPLRVDGVRSRKKVKGKT
jgi:hypothetical protein